MKNAEEVIDKITGQVVKSEDKIGLYILLVIFFVLIYLFYR